MKVLYFLVGLLFGVSLASQVGLVQIERVNRQWEKDITAYSLTGYYEGWSRGKAASDMMSEWKLYNCYEQLKRSHK